MILCNATDVSWTEVPENEFRGGRQRFRRGRYAAGSHLRPGRRVPLSRLVVLSTAQRPREAVISHRPRAPRRNRRPRRTARRHASPFRHHILAGRVPPADTGTSSAGKSVLRIITLSIVSFTIFSSFSFINLFLLFFTNQFPVLYNLFIDHSRKKWTNSSGDDKAD